MRRHPLAMEGTRLLLLCLGWLLLAADVAGFNLDTSDVIVMRPPVHASRTNDSYFGYTVALLENTEGKWVLVGAPKSSSVHTPSDIRTPGALYKCAVTGGDCEEILVDSDGDTCYLSLGQAIPCSFDNGRYRVKSYKENQWLGAGLDVHDSKGVFTVCAPRWINQFFLESHGEFLINGYCWELSKDMIQSKTRSLHPLQNIDYQIVDGEYRYGSGLTGMTVHYLTNATSQTDDMRLLLAAPGVWSQTGSVVEMRSPRSDTVVPLIHELLEGSFLGYDISSGVFFPDKKVLNVVGVPRARRSSFVGEVYIYYDDFKYLIKKVGAVSGEYFGAAVAAIDINKDGLDDLIVGAPFYYEENTVDEGCAYVYMNQGHRAGDPLLETDYKLRGSRSSYARFGTTIAGVGDLDLDGFRDVAVSAPYEDDGRGVVYIYRGYVAGIYPQHSQRIAAASVADGLRGFGWSISRSMDVDDNRYPDVAIGAYQSDSAVLLRTRPVIRTSANIRFNPAQIQTNVADCVNADGERVSCVRVSACFYYDGAHVPASTKIQYTLAIVAASTNRGFFFENNRSSLQVKRVVKLAKETLECDIHSLLLRANIKDKITPLSFSLDYDIIDDVTARRRRRQTVLPLPPVISADDNVHVLELLGFAHACGDDNNCTSDLSITMKSDFNEPYLVPGINNDISFTITVTNRGESAHQTKIEGYYTSAASFIGSDPSQYACQANPDVTGRGRGLVCEIANPLPFDASATLTIRFDTSTLRDDRQFTFTMETLTTSYDVDTGASEKSAKVALDVFHKADVTITSAAQPEQLVYATKKPDATLPLELKNYTREITHVYNLINLGKSAVSGGQLFIRWPHMTASGMTVVRIVKRFRISRPDIMSCNDTSIVYVQPKSTG
ncbi:PREDICTED: integrin alpha-4-like, partial [Priapulus caudatus]|uniref:Integrin alpha-4-like n=1 Tax=Priapulus caudatus TaxID=37621 RepID=A0ABM1ENS1_PRICU